MYKSHSEADFHEAQRLCASGLSDYEVGRRLGIARTTVQNWRKRTSPPRGTCRVGSGRSFVVTDPVRYAYLLGAYLGDGHLCRTSANSWRLSIYCDSAYPEIRPRSRIAIRPLLRGLIHSDGCRASNHFTTKLRGGRVVNYSYPRYFFSNLSGDIRAIFCEHCELVGVSWTQSNCRNISVSRRQSVAILDSFVGPKR